MTRSKRASYNYEQAAQRWGPMAVVFVIVGGAMLVAGGLYFALHTPHQRYQRVPTWA
jgi:hypothetical protein